MFRLRLMGWALLEAGFEVASESSIDGAVERTERLTPEVIVFNTSVPPEAKARCIQVLRAINASSTNVLSKKRWRFANSTMPRREASPL